MSASLFDTSWDNKNGQSVTAAWEVHVPRRHNAYDSDGATDLSMR